MISRAIGGTQAAFARAHIDAWIPITCTATKPVWRR
jgi:hypothetical protein